MAMKRKPAPRKAAATSREREGKAKKKLEKEAGYWSHHPAEPDASPQQEEGANMLGAAPPADLQGPQHDSRSNLAQTMESYRESYGESQNCGDMVATILRCRNLDELEVFVYEKTGRAYPGLNPGHRRMNCGNVLRALVRQRDPDTMAWLLDTRPGTTFPI